ncbi:MULTISPECIES: PTS sugar transporter subunit IIA [unclassified Serratia (in: enterobacteria)]|uniref:PTS sugar transporter subunit IIA n=1 Tax=unclassified Serratia (in: enterobacteria) TaxID=2647522 RepID=UPI00046A19A1|nr:MULTISPECIES: PTS sugar transporter subunit IIA [unclassified Serratia (in: enterobacteria)]
MIVTASLDNELMLLKHADVDRQQLFREINQILTARDMVLPSYLDALIAREDNNPTAMQLENMGVAIPHVDIEHIKEEKLVVVTCPEGMEFKQAEDPDLTMKVHVIFFLLLKEKDAHIEFLMKLIGLFRQTDKMNLILQSDSKQEVKEILLASLQ